MKKLLIFAILAVNISAQVSIAVGLDTTHLAFHNDDVTLNENNRLIGLEYSKGNNLISFTKFDNSYYNKSWSLNYRHLVGKGKVRFLSGVSLIKGYNDINYIKSNTDESLIWEGDNPFYIGNGYSIIPTCGIEVTLNSHVKLETSLMTNALISTVKYTF